MNAPEEKVVIDIEKFKITMKRKLMPMQQHWHIQRSFRDCFDAMFKPMVDSTAIFASVLETVAKNMQKQVFFAEVKK